MPNRYEEVINAFLNGRANRCSYDSCEVDFTRNTTTLRHGKFYYAEKRDGYVTTYINNEWPFDVKFAAFCRVNYLASKLIGQGVFTIDHVRKTVDYKSFYKPQTGYYTITLTFPPDVTSWDEWMAYRMMTSEQ